MGYVQQLLSQRANEDANRIAFVHGHLGTVLTWGDVAFHAAEWLEHMDTASEPRTRLVGLALSAPTSFCSSYLAALGSGIPIAPLDPRATADELGERASVLALTDVIGDRLDAAQTRALTDVGARVWIKGARGMQLIVNSAGRRNSISETIAPSVVLATSGSTGSPKLVPLSERQLLYVAGQVVTHHRLGRDDRGYSPLPLFHINAQVVGVLATLISGGSLVVEERFGKESFWDTARELGATWLNLVPAILAVLGAMRGPACSEAGAIRFARSASSPLSDAVRERFESSSGIGVLETYGMTEAASQITANPLRPENRRSGSVGVPVGVDLRVVDDNGNSMRSGETGTVQLRGPGVVNRYLAPGRMHANPAREANGWFTTGDLGHQDTDGFVFLVGRVDDVINRGGEKVYPREIEEVLLRDQRVSDAAATGRPHPTLGTQPVAFVTTSLPADARARLSTELAQSCAAALSRYKRPVEIFVTDALPVGATGKIARHRLAQFSELALGGETISAPSTAS